LDLKPSLLVGSSSKEFTGPTSRILL